MSINCLAKSTIKLRAYAHKNAHLLMRLIAVCLRLMLQGPLEALKLACRAF